MAPAWSSQRPSRKNSLTSTDVDVGVESPDPWGYDGDPSDPFADFGSSFSSTNLVGGRPSMTHKVVSGSGIGEGSRAESLSSGLFDDNGEHAQLDSNQAGGWDGAGADSGGSSRVQESVMEATVSIFRPSDLAGLVWGLASLKFQPSAAWLDRWVSFCLVDAWRNGVSKVLVPLCLE